MMDETTEGTDYAGPVKYVIWKDETGVCGAFPWCFEGSDWGDTGSCATFEEAIAATVGRDAPTGPYMIQVVEA